MRVWLLTLLEISGYPVLTKGITIINITKCSKNPLLLAGIAGLCFLAAASSLLGWWLPAEWWPPLVIVASVASLLLFVVYFGVWAIPPIVADVILLWAVFAKSWSVSVLRGV